MASFNKVVLVGNLTRDPELKTLPSGSQVARLGLAVNNSYKSKDGNVIEDKLFIDADIFGKQAEAVDQYMSKGSSVLVEGRLRYHTWESQDGTKRSRHDILAQRVVFMGSKSNGSNTTTNSKPVDQNDAEPVEEDDIPF